MSWEFSHDCEQDGAWRVVRLSELMPLIKEQN